jgi:hypothetical protein
VSEDVFNIVQIGPQGGSFTAPGSAAAATFLFPITDVINVDLDLGSAYPTLHRGRNVRNLGGSGYHGVRRASGTLPFEVRFEDLAPILEMIYAGAISASGSGPYTRLYPFEAVSPTIIPATIEVGNIDLAAAQERIVSALVNSLTLGFSPVTPGQASPWTGSAELVGFDREVNAVTASLSPKANPLEPAQGHLTRLYEGSTSTAFGSLGELAGSLRSYTQTATRSLVLRAYGSASDKATKFGFSDLSTTTYEMLIAVSASAKTDLHDVWNTSGATLGERRLRIQASGSASKKLTIDARAGLFAIPWDSSDGERVYKVSGEFADDTTLGASHTIEIVNNLA